MFRSCPLSVTVSLTAALAVMMSSEVPRLVAVVREGASLTQELVRQMDQGARRQAELEELQAFFLSAYEAKDQVVRDFLAGRRSLLETAARFRAINRRMPGHWSPVWPGVSEDERACRQLISWIYSSLLEMSPQLATATEARLLRELEEHRDDSGEVQLPEN